MYFNSYAFLLLFFPITLIGYYLIQRYFRQVVGEIWLLAASVVFYLCFSVPLSSVLLISVIVNFLIYKLIRRYQSGGKNKAVRNTTACGVVMNVLLLLVFKYASVYMPVLGNVFGHDFSTIHILAPIGISFFTFSQISFLLECSKDDAHEYSFWDYALYVLFFPKILSGPIATAQDLVPQFHDETRRHFAAESFSKGIYAFGFGLAKKVLLADFLAIIADYAFGNVAQCSGMEALAAVFAYGLQLYFDFSGYCDMATGVCLMLNIDLAQNFDSPYKAVNIIDFWKRWHITLTNFLTKYIYFPLGGNRKGKTRQYLNILIVFLISGIWHGAGLTFVVWGLIHGILNVLTRICKPVIEKIPRVVSVLLTYLAVTVSWTFFRANSVADAVALLSKPFTAAFGQFNADLIESMLQPTIFSLLNVALPFNVALVLLFGGCFAMIFHTKNTNTKVREFRPTFGRLIVSFLLIFVSMLSLTGFSSFIYGGF